MQVACGLFEAGGTSLASIATEVGYSSVSALSAAFTKLLKRRPGSYQKPTSHPA
jgi:AraC-like DNA-binding protein